MQLTSSLSLIANMQRRSSAQNEAQKLAADPASRGWITALHLAACRRWLSHNPPMLVEAEATLHLLHGLADDLGVITPRHDATGLPGDCPLPLIRPEDTVPTMWRLMEALERALAKAIVAKAE